jgi:hypothetical protein
MSTCEKLDRFIKIHFIYYNNFLQANMTDLMELAWGIIAAEEAETASKIIQKSWIQQVKGLCTAFQSLSTVILRDNWFHSRDFIFLCRLLRVLAQKGAQTLFDSAMLLQALRRHFQPLDPSSFPTLATVFLRECGLGAPTDDVLDARVVRSLRESLSDSLADGTDPTSAHCRYTLIVDPTDCEAGVDLLFALKLLDPTTTKIVSLSDFPEDASPTMTTAALAQIKKCIEEGETLLLVNSAPLQSAIYDVINRHYANSVREDGRTDAFANIPLGSFSSLVRVHESFRLIVHVPISQLPETPLPFLNRFEKYTLSVRDALAQRVLEVSLNPPHSLLCIPKPEHRQRIFRELEAGVNDFVAFAGGSTSFYGMSSTETVPALVLRALEDACVSTTSDFEPRPSVLAGIMLIEKQQHPLEEEQDNEMHFMDVESAYLQQFDVDSDLDHSLIDNAEKTEIDPLVAKDPAADLDNPAALNGRLGEMNMEEVDYMPTILQPVEERAGIDSDYAYQSSKRSDEVNVRRRARPRASHAVIDSNRNDPLPTRLRSLIRALNFQVMETARVESIFRLRDRLPAVYMREYLDNQQHLSVFSLLKQVLRSSLRMNETPGRTTEKLVVYTRTDSHLLRLVTDGAYVERIFGFLRGSGHGSATASATATTTATAEDSDPSTFTATIVSSVAEAPESSLVSTICIIPLASFSNSGDCARTIRACMCPDGGRRVLIIVADMKQVLCSI